MKSLFIAFIFLFSIAAQAQDFSCVSLFAQSQNFEFTEDQIQAMYQIAESQVRASRLPMSDPSKSIVLNKVQEDIQILRDMIGDKELVNRTYRGIYNEVEFGIREDRTQINERNSRKRSFNQQIKEHVRRKRISALLEKYAVENLDWALVEASIKNELNDVKILLDAGAKIEAKNKIKCTALQLAAWNGYLKLVKLLIERGSDLETGNGEADYGTALHFAARRGQLEVVKFLLEKRANVMAVDADRQSALHRAAREGHLDVVRLLVEKGANIYATNMLGQTALSLAQQLSQHKVTKYLESVIKEGEEKAKLQSKGEAP